MKAVVYPKYGSSGVRQLEEVAKPTPKHVVEREYRVPSPSGLSYP